MEVLVGTSSISLMVNGEFSTARIAFQRVILAVFVRVSSVGPSLQALLRYDSYMPVPWSKLRLYAYSGMVINASIFSF